MKALWNISWSQYSLAERVEIIKEYFVIYHTFVDLTGDGIMPAPFSSSILHIIDFFGNSTSRGNLYVDPVLESSRTFVYAAVLCSVSPSNSSL